MQFTKMHGLGNDFIVIHGLPALPKDAAETAVRWCHRHFGIGADGVVYILPSERADFLMRIMNSDGTEAEQCGNAVRCVAKYVYDNGLTDRTELSIETAGAGVQPVQLTIEAGKAAAVRVNMGVPVLHGPSVPVLVDREPVIQETIEVGEAAERVSFTFTAVSMGNPHCVIFAEDASAVELHKWGPLLEKHALFPNRMNVEFVSVRSREHLDMRVWERGAGPTLACGTGACATVVAAVLNGKAERRATVTLTGGDLFIEWDEASGVVYMTGPAATVYSGII